MFHPPSCWRFKHIPLHCIFIVTVHSLVSYTFICVLQDMISEVLPVTGNKGVKKVTNVANGTTNYWNGGGEEEGRKNTRRTESVG